MNLLETIQKRIPYRYGVLLAIILAHKSIIRNVFYLGLN
ncbi:hypothetical protein LMT8_02925 [Leuconostoc mesenteroides subsp. cremoris TIFN8]|nr:hypothetical protein LMT8_02925 [Leuconostoc mesenteroides subsp. cremoris TIFN8]